MWHSGRGLFATPLRSLLTVFVGCNLGITVLKPTRNPESWTNLLLQRKSEHIPYWLADRWLFSRTFWKQHSVKQQTFIKRLLGIVAVLGGTLVELLGMWLTTYRSRCWCKFPLSPAILLILIKSHILLAQASFFVKMAPCFMRLGLFASSYY